MEHSFVDKNKFVKRDIAVEFENLLTKIDDAIPITEKENAYEFLRASTTNVSQNIFRCKDTVFKSLKNICDNKDIVLLSGDKDSSIIIMNKTDYVNKVNELISKGINLNKYTLCEDTIINDLNNFQAFLYRNFKKHKNYKDMYPNSNQPARFFATAKSHKFNSLADINLKDLKLRPIIDQTNTLTHKAAKIISKYLSPLGKNDFVITDTLTFPSLIKDISRADDEEDVSYDVESLFTSIPVQKTIEYIIHVIYENKTNQPFCDKKLIFKNFFRTLNKRLHLLRK